MFEKAVTPPGVEAVLRRWIFDAPNVLKLACFRSAKLEHQFWLGFGGYFILTLGSPDFARRSARYQRLHGSPIPFLAEGTLPHTAAMSLGRLTIVSDFTIEGWSNSFAVSPGSSALIRNVELSSIGPAREVGSFEVENAFAGEFGRGLTLDNLADDIELLTIRLLDDYVPRVASDAA